MSVDPDNLISGIGGRVISGDGGRDGRAQSVRAASVDRRGIAPRQRYQRTSGYADSCRLACGLRPKPAHSAVDCVGNDGDERSNRDVFRGRRSRGRGLLGLRKIRSIGICLIIGGIPLAISQMLPIAQLFAGGVAMVFCQVLGLVEPVGDDGRNDAVASEAAGFVLTVITGGILMTLSAGCGLLLQRFIPDPWRPAVDSDET